MFSAEQILIFLGVLVATGLLMKWNRKKEISSYSYPPSLLSLPLFGSIGLVFIRDVTSACEYFMKKARTLGPIFTLRFGNRLVVTLNSKDALEKAYVKNAAAFSDRPKLFMEEMSNPDNKGIVFVRKAAEWKKANKLSVSILKEFGLGSKCIMETRISKETEAIADFITKTKGEPFDPEEMCILATSNVMMNILFGRRRDYELGISELSLKMRQYVTGVSFLYDVAPIIQILPSYRKQILTFTEICKTLFELIEAEIAQSLQNPAEACFAQSYIEKAEGDYDRAQLNYLLRDLISAGTDTSSVTLQWGLLALANNPTIQQRLHAEIDDVITKDRLPTLQDEAKLPYVQATILELTRWRTLAPVAAPRFTSRSSVVDGYLIPAGTMVIANLYAVHNDINVWKDPDVFRPERFLDRENNVVGKDKIIPFSIGRRSCPGESLARAEIFLILTSLVKRFLILPPEGEHKINESPRVTVSTVVSPAPFKIRLLERK